MKLKLISSLAVAGALLAAQGSLSAQTIGFKVGPTFSTQHFSDSGENEGMGYLTSFGGGGFLRFGMAGLGMQGELLAMTKGAKITSGNSEIKSKVTYLEVPILARFGLGTGMASPYVMVGPSFAFELSCKYNTNITIPGVPASGNCENEGDTADRKKFDIGATGVAGLQFSMGPGALLIEGRYTHGLMNIEKDDGFPKYTNRSFAVMAGYAFTMQ